MVTAIAAMQLVEQGLINLDDGEQLEACLWELQDRKVLERDQQGGLELVPKQSKVTLRMLLSHTAGFGYSFANPKLKEWSEPTGISEVSSEEFDIFAQPLVNQPGTAWEYGINMDWVGRLIERISGTGLHDYMQRNIFQPLGISSISFFPTTEQMALLAYLHERRADGTIQARDGGHLLKTPLRVHEAKRNTVIQAGGHGLFGTPRDYCQIVAVLLNGGVHAPSGMRILEAKTVANMLENQISEHPDFARDVGPACKPSLVNSAAETYPQPHEQPQGWGMSFFRLLHPSHTGRSGNTVWWSGLANLIWWADVENGVGGMVASQILPFNDPDVFACHEELEIALYEGIVGQS
ncbi:hypothetical protein AAFC00_002389 [Neodothiora populina]